MKVLDELERKRAEAISVDWSVDALRSLLRYGRKNEGPWDEIDPGKEIPNDDHASLIIAAIGALDDLIAIARAAAAVDKQNDANIKHARGSRADIELRRALARLAAKGQP